MGGFQPAMMSFKSFLQTQDDQISDEEAIKKYAEYKMEFKRQQLNEFFVTHKEEEWFKQKYHPDDSVKRKGELRDFLKKRVEVFQEFLDSGKIKAKKLDCENQDDLIKLLDSVVIKLEGGSDFDLTVLDLPDPEENKKDSNDKDDDDKKDGPVDRDTAVMNKAKEMLDFLDSKPDESKRKGEDSDGEDSKKKDEKKEEKEEKEDEMKDNDQEIKETGDDSLNKSSEESPDEEKKD